MKIHHELNIETTRFKKNSKSRGLILAIENSPNSICKRFDLTDKLDMPFRVPANKELSENYNSIITQLASTHPNSLEKTRHEHVIYSKLKKATKLKVYRSVWIGLWNIDFLIPGIKGNRKGDISENGLIIAIDGPIHNSEPKMLKDELVNRFATHLKIGFTTIINEDVGHSMTNSFINRISDLPRNDHRSRVKLWRTIHIETLIQQMPLEKLSNLYGMTPMKFKWAANRVHEISQKKNFQIKKAIRNKGVTK